MEIKYDIASADDIPCIVEMKIEMFREFGHAQYLDKNAREITVECMRQTWQFTF